MERNANMIKKPGLVRYKTALNGSYLQAIPVYDSPLSYISPLTTARPE
jgi:hypothetical protein